MTFLRLFRAGFHSVLLFALPWLVGAIAVAVSKAGEVAETSARFAEIFGFFAVPLLFLQVTAISIKVTRERRALALDGHRGLAGFAIAVDRHARVLTGRGLGLAFVAAVLVGLAISVEWAQLGTLAVAAIGLLYIFATMALLASAFSVREFDDRVVRARGSIERELSPSVVDSGETVEERFSLAKVPVPPGFRLHIDEDLPPRLGGATRFALDRSVSRTKVTVSAPLPRTARGLYTLGPASIFYEDVLGLTRVFVASRATAGLRILPRLRGLAFLNHPRARAKADGALSVLARQATEEHFSVREYRSGDDLRRVHWRHSVNLGNLQVRVPEAIPFTPRKVRLVLDTYLPPTFDASDEQLGDLLDLLVEGWVSLANTLMRRGERVALALAVIDPATGQLVPRELDCKRGEERRFRALGAEASWQRHVDAHQTIGAGFDAKVSQIVVTAGFSLPRPGGSFGSSLILAESHDIRRVDPEPSLLKRLFVHSYPVGADDNAIDWRSVFAPKASPNHVRTRMNEAFSSALARAQASATPVMRLRRQGAQLSLEQA